MDNLIKALQFWTRVRNYCTRRGARVFFKRPFVINTPVSFISFTFDDFPRSALSTGGAILRNYGVRGTYYASLGLLGKQAPTGPMFLLEDLGELLGQGHELGCHTYAHCHSSETATSVFMDSIIQNRLTLSELFPGASFRTFSYPIGLPRIRTKRRVAQHFVCSRGGGQTFNAGTADLNCLSAYFLEKSRDNPESVKNVIDQNRKARGWLIFASHDICASPTPWGCTPEYFEDIVRWSVESGARILPVVEAWEALRATPAL